jgi:hypothetical protein
MNIKAKEIRKTERNAFVLQWSTHFRSYYASVPQTEGSKRRIEKITQWEAL